MLLITWLEEPATGYVDVLDWALFAKSGEQQALRHIYVGPNGGKYEAICDLRVTEQEAIFDYGPYPSKKVVSGITKLVFSNRRRDWVQHVQWQDKDSISWMDCLVDINEGYLTGGVDVSKGERARIIRTALDRPGQQRLKALLRTTYAGRCAITGCDVDGVLEAAHIVAVSNEGDDTISNAILMRSDIHRLFDLGLISISVDHQVLLSPRLSGSVYEAELKRRVINLPTHVADHPSPAGLEEHRRKFCFSELAKAS